MSANTYRRYLLTLLTTVLTFNFVDRFALGMVLQNIKVDLVLSDTQLGFMSGIAFALFYSVMGIPIARWADRGNRATIISLTAALWSVAVGSCGLAGSFIQLLMIRIGVAVGEAGGFVPGFSLLGDYFNRIERPRAVAIYLLAGPLAIIVGYLLAGWLNEFYGWRVMFMLLGIPGLLLAAVALFTLRDPRRSTSTLSSFCSSRSASAAGQTAQPSLKEVVATLAANATFRQLLFCISIQFFFVYGILQWQPSFFIRSYGLASGQIGTWFAAIYGMGGVLGNYLGGAWASRHAAGNERLQLKAVAIAMTGSAVLSTCVYVSPSLYVTFGLMGGVMFAQTAVNGPLYATIQTLVPERMRAVAIALVMFFANLIGMGLGPLAAGALSDALRPWAAQESLRYALLMLSPGLFWAACHAWRASKTVTRDLAALPMVHDHVAGSMILREAQ